MACGGTRSGCRERDGSLPEVARVVRQRVQHWLTLSPVLASCWPRVGPWTLAGITDINVHLRKLGALAIDPRTPCWPMSSRVVATQVCKRVI